MPQLNEILDNRVKKFVKRSYRPWDLSGNLDSEKNKEQVEPIQESCSNILLPIEESNTNRTQYKHKIDTIWGQTEHNKNFKGTQTEHGPETTHLFDSIITEKKEALVETSNAISTQLDEKNKTQIEHKIPTKLNTKSDTNRTQAIVGKTQTEHKVDIEPNTPILKIRTQTAHKLDTNISFASLSGIQREIVILIFNHCKIAKQDSTNEISISYISASLNVRIGSVKNSITRLEQKKFVIRLEYKIGRGGWSRYKLSDSLYSELLYLDKTHKLDTNNTQIEYKSNTESHTKQYTTSPSSSSLNKSTTNEPEESFSKTALPPDWETIDISPLEFIGFNTNKLQQIYQAGKLTAEMVQDSIHAYAFDCEVNKVQHNNPIAFIMSLLKVKGMPYEFPQNYESPRDRALRRYVEQKKAQQERAKQLQALLIETAFDEWRSKFTPEALEALVPSQGMNTDGSRYKALLQLHFEQHVWPQKMQELPNA